MCLEELLLYTVVGAEHTVVYLQVHGTVVYLLFLSVDDLFCYQTLVVSVTLAVLTHGWETDTVTQ